MRIRSTVCTQSKSCAASRVLFVCSAPMKWRRKLRPAQRLEVRARLLQVVLAEVGEPRVERRPHPFERLRLGDTDQGDGGGVAAGSQCRDRDALPHGSNAVSRILRNS